MARYRNDFDDERDFQTRNDRFGRERPWNNARPYSGGGRLENESERAEFGRYGERAGYEYDEPRYSGYPGRYREQESRQPYYDGRDPSARPYYYDRGARSRVRARDIMTRELAVATRDTPLRDVAVLMKEEDTGVIPVVDYTSSGNGKGTAEQRNLNTSNYSRGKLVGLITDRDIVLRCVADGKDCSVTRAEEIMSTDISAARPNDRVLDIIRKMGDKQVRRIPVLSESGNLLGMISMSDVALETEADHELGEALEDISKESSFWRKLFG
jgi:CBS domain-containing protein